MKPIRAPATDLALAKDILALPNRDRLARLSDSLRLPRPTRAFLDSDGFLTWAWYRQSYKSNKNLEEPGARRHPPELQKPPSDLCVRFSELAGGTDEQIRVFAGKWGPLGMEMDGRDQEEIAQWRDCAELAAALLRFSAAQTNRKRGDDKDWSTICKSIGVEIDRAHLGAMPQKAITALAVNRWFAGMRGHRILEIIDRQLQVRPGASNLLGVLVAQIAHAIARSDELVVCAGCKRPFRPNRAPSRGFADTVEPAEKPKCRNATPLEIGGKGRSREKPDLVGLRNMVYSSPFGCLCLPWVSLGYSLMLLHESLPSVFSWPKLRRLRAAPAAGADLNIAEPTHLSHASLAIGEPIE